MHYKKIFTDGSNEAALFDGVHLREAIRLKRVNFILTMFSFTQSPSVMAEDEVSFPDSLHCQNIITSKYLVLSTSTTAKNFILIEF